MADKLVSQDPTKPGINKVNGPTLTSGGAVPLAGLDTTGAANGNVITLTGGVWTPGSGGASADTASNVGAGTGTIFKQKTGANFEFKTLIAGSNITLTNGVSDITIDSTATGPFSQSFASTAQVITGAGSLTIAHGMAGTPSLIQCRLNCVTGELGYTAGDQVLMDDTTQATTASNEGISIVPDATNLNIRFGAAASTFELPNKGTGVRGAITNANWTITFRAWR